MLQRDEEMTVSSDSQDSSSLGDEEHATSVPKESSGNMSDSSVDHSNEEKSSYVQGTTLFGPPPSETGDRNSRILVDLSDEQDANSNTEESPKTRTLKSGSLKGNGVSNDQSRDSKDAGDGRRGVRRRVRANENVVVYVDGIENVRSFSDVDVRDEMERYFPGKQWYVFFIRNGGLRIQGFKYQEDVDFLTSINWNTHFGDKGKPFGGVKTVKAKLSVPKEQLETEVRLLVPATVNRQKLATRLEQDRYVGVEIVFLDEISEGGYDRPARLRMQSCEQHDRIIEDGLMIGCKYPTYAMDWGVWKRQERCFNCQSRSAHYSIGCERDPVCPRCAGSHPLDECESELVRCAACGSSEHKVWSEICPVFLRRIVTESEKIGVPCPPFWRGIRLSKVRVPNRSVSTIRNSAFRASHVSYAQKLAGDTFSQRQRDDNYEAPIEQFHHRQNYAAPFSRPERYGQYRPRPQRQWFPNRQQQSQPNVNEDSVDMSDREETNQVSEEHLIETVASKIMKRFEVRILSILCACKDSMLSKDEDQKGEVGPGTAESPPKSAEREERPLFENETTERRENKKSGEKGILEVMKKIAVSMEQKKAIVGFIELLMAVLSPTDEDEDDPPEPGEIREAASRHNAKNGQ